jgi:hypothetical protein
MPTPINWLTSRRKPRVRWTAGLAPAAALLPAPRPIARSRRFARGSGHLVLPAPLGTADPLHSSGLSPVARRVPFRRGRAGLVPAGTILGPLLPGGSLLGEDGSSVLLEAGGHTSLESGVVAAMAGRSLAVGSGRMARGGGVWLPALPRPTGSSLSPGGGFLVLEDGTRILLESGSNLLLESGAPSSGSPSGFAILLEDGTSILPESGSRLLLEAGILLPELFDPYLASVVSVRTPDPSLCLFDPYEANIVGLATLVSPYPIPVGSPRDLPVQCRLPGGLPGAMSAGDTLGMAVVPIGQATTTFTPTASWYTAGDTQTGYDQAQVLASWQASDAALLQASVLYALEVYWAPAATPSRLELVAWVPLRARNPSGP